MAAFNAEKDPKGYATFGGQISTSIRLSEVAEAGLRFEASAFNLAGRNAAADIAAAGYPTVPLYGPEGFSSEAHNAFRFSRIFVDREHGIPFLSSSEIISMRPREERFLSRKHTSRIDYLLVKPWDVMISCSGTVGNVGLAGRTFQGKALSQDAIRLRCKTPEDAGYVAAFLRCRHGRALIGQATYGSVIVHIEPEHLTRIIIPVLHDGPRLRIGRDMCTATNLRDEANDLLDQADNLIYERLALPPLRVAQQRKSVAVTVKASSLAQRLDATYHDPLAKVALRNLKKCGAELLPIEHPRISSEVRAITKFRKRVYVPERGIPLLSSKQLFQIDPVDVKRLAKGAHLKDLKEIQLTENMIAVTCSGTIGRIQIIPKYMEDWTANQHAHRIITAGDMNAGFIYAWLASDYGHILMSRHSYGSVILEMDKNMLGSVPIPIPSDGVIQEIGDLVLRANRLRNDAWTVEQSAIRNLELAIDGASGVK